MIPKRVFTYWEGTWSDNEERCWNSVKEVFHDWKIEIITPESLPYNLDANFFFSIPLRSQRADYIRYFELFERGGFWLDTDVVALRSFKFLREYSFVAGYESPEYVNNAVMGAMPEHNLFLYCMARFPNYMQYGRSATAPLLLTEALQHWNYFKACTDEQIMLLPPAAFYPVHWTCKQSDVAFEKITPENFPNSYAFHRWDWIWRQYE